MKNAINPLFPAGRKALPLAHYLLPFVFITILFTRLPTPAHAQVAIGDSVKGVDESAVLELFSQTKGFLPPRMTTAMRDSISNPAEGLIVFDTDLNKLLYYHNGWNDFGLWVLRDSTSGNIYYTGKIAIGPSSGTDTIPASLNISGTAGIYASVHTDTSRPAYFFIDSIDNDLDFNIGTFLNTVKNGTPSELTIGSYSYLEAGDQLNIGIGGEAFYTGEGGDLDDFEEIPVTVGVLGNNYILDTGAVAIAGGLFGIAESDHLGINIGSFANAMSNSTYANIAGMFLASGGGPNVLQVVHDSFPDRFTAAALLCNYSNDSSDFNLFSLGGGKSHFDAAVSIGRGAYQLYSQHPLTVQGSKGIRSELKVGAFTGATPHYFNAELTNSSGNNTHFVVNTERTGTAGQHTTAMSSFLEGADTVLVAFMGQGFYNGSGGDLNNPQDMPQTGGIYGDAYISDTSAEVFAAGTAGLASSEQAGINVGTYSLATEAAYSNIASYAVANREADSYKYLIDSLRNRFPASFSTGLFVNNGDSMIGDFNIYAYGDAKSYFGGRVGIGTSAPLSKLDVAGAVNASAYLINGDTLNIDGAWSSSGNDIYYDAGRVSIGLSGFNPDDTAVLNVMGEVVMVNDTDNFPAAYFSLKNSPDGLWHGNASAAMGIMNEDSSQLFFGAGYDDSTLIGGICYVEEEKWNLISINSSGFEGNHDLGILMLSIEGDPDSIGFEIGPEDLGAGSVMSLSPTATFLVHGSDSDAQMMLMTDSAFILGVFNAPINLDSVPILTGLRIDTSKVRIGFRESNYTHIDENGIGINTDTPDTELHVNGDIKQKIYTSNVSNPPTDAELDNLFTSPSSKGNGWTAYVKDSNTENLYQIMVAGNDWYILTTAKAQ